MCRYYCQKTVTSKIQTLMITALGDWGWYPQISKVSPHTNTFLYKLASDLCAHYSNTLKTRKVAVGHISPSGLKSALYYRSIY